MTSRKDMAVIYVTNLKKLLIPELSVEKVDN